MSSFEERARLRASWPTRLGTLLDKQEQVVGGTVAGRIAMVWQITLDAWASAGQPIPNYARSETPGTLRRLGDL